MRKLLILSLTALLVTSFAVGSVLACTFTPGYWKNDRMHPWPISPWTIQGIDAMIILRTPVRGDAWVNLAQKVIAAELSMAADSTAAWSAPTEFGGYPLGMVGMVADAYVLLNAETSYPPGAPNRDAVLTLAGEIDYWLNFYDTD